MIHTDGKPTICSKDTTIKEIGIRNYPRKKELDTLDNWGIDKLIKEGGVMIFKNTNKGGN